MCTKDVLYGSMYGYAVAMYGYAVAMYWYAVAMYEYAVAMYEYAFNEGGGGVNKITCRKKWALRQVAHEPIIA